ncbi:hypothetical protein KFL_000730260 [Klebsormidium nitens]|uniref:Uncharacterized protein n=1 Tax=Klebsormidium nitens TaxID=105231 RepID=A0A1Y1HVG6_KLENI|nr:hypothetical protein KFL_000730260 [Klebsormidium nitens]|eukprot:GAQ81189.1 hypothetical protein KFL_000730260 [Klebsormidium nitens]
MATGGERAKLLVRLLWGGATDWYTPDVMEASDCEFRSFAELTDLWYKVHSDPRLAKALSVAVVKDEKWGASQMVDFWKHMTVFKAVWKDFTISELGQLLRTVIRNERAQSRSTFSSNRDSDSESDEEGEESEDDNDDSFADAFEVAEEVCGMFSCIFRVLELTPAQQKDLFKAAVKGLFGGENLYYLVEAGLGLNLTSSEFQELRRKESPKTQARITKQIQEEEAYWCDEDSPQPSAPPPYASRNGSCCSNSAKRGCLRRQCGGCCKKGFGGACAVHLGTVAAAVRAPPAGKCVGTGAATSAAANLSSEAAPFVPATSAPAYREPIYTAEETRVVKSEAELEKVLTAGGAFKRVIFRDFYVKPEQFGRMVALFGAGLECIEMSGGEGYQLNGESIRGVATACPKLRKFSMESASSIKDDAFAALLKSCPELEYLDTRGNDKVSGSLSDKSFKLLQTDSTLAPKLRKLYVVDQRMSKKIAEKLVKMRPQLFIQGGESDGDGYASAMVMQMTGASYGDGIWGVGAGATPPSFGFQKYSNYDFF